LQVSRWVLITCPAIFSSILPVPSARICLVHYDYNTEIIFCPCGQMQLDSEQNDLLHTESGHCIKMQVLIMTTASRIVKVLRTLLMSVVFLPLKYFLTHAQRLCDLSYFSRD
jgi:hypothetical protein